jgi:hypothetical protein
MQPNVKDRKYPLQFLGNMKFFKSSQILNFMKIRPVETELFHADEQIDITQLIAGYLQFCRA